MSGWLVRTAAGADLAAIVAIEAAVFRDLSWGARSLEEGLAAPLVSALLALRPGGGPQGFLLWRTLGEEGEILSVGVLAGARRGGAGGALVEAAIGDARAEGLGALFLEVDDRNAAARALYEAKGFTEVGRRRGYYRNGHDALVLRKYL